MSKPKIPEAWLHNDAFTAIQRRGSVWKVVDGNPWVKSPHQDTYVLHGDDWSLGLFDSRHAAEKFIHSINGGKAVDHGHHGSPIPDFIVCPNHDGSQFYIQAKSRMIDPEGEKLKAELLAKRGIKPDGHDDLPGH